MSRLRPLALFVFALCLMAPAADWPQWRGPNRDGKSAEAGLLQSWPAGGPRLVWKTQGLGEGFAGPAVVGNRLFIQGQQGGQEFVLAIDVSTGKQVWKVPTGNSYREQHGNGPRGTPTVDGSRLYAIAADGTLLCIETETGKRVWGLNFTDRFGGRLPTWAYSESPLVEGDLLIVTPGGPGAAVVALNKNTGAVVWKSQDDRPGYSSAIAFDAAGTRVVALLTGQAAIGLDVKNGNLLWRYTRVANRVANVATPVFHNGHVFFSSDYGTGCVLLKIAAEGGAVKASEVYFSRDMRNHYTTSVLLGDYLYGFSSEILTAMNFMTGQVAWRNRSVGKGNCIYADQRLYCMGEDGMVGLIDPTPAGYEEVSRFQISRGEYNTWTPPVIANGKLYLREQDNLYCYSVKR